MSSSDCDKNALSHSISIKDPNTEQSGFITVKLKPCLLPNMGQKSEIPAMTQYMQDAILHPS